MLYVFNRRDWQIPLLLPPAFVRGLLHWLFECKRLKKYIEMERLIWLRCDAPSEVRSAAAAAAARRAIERSDNFNDAREKPVDRSRGGGTERRGSGSWNGSRTCLFLFLFYGRMETTDKV